MNAVTTRTYLAIIMYQGFLQFENDVQVKHERIEVYSFFFPGR